MCASCCTRKTPMWRDAEDGTPLCNACGIRCVLSHWEHILVHYNLFVTLRQTQRSIIFHTTLFHLLAVICGLVLGRPKDSL